MILQYQYHLIYGIGEWILTPYYRNLEVKTSEIASVGETDVFRGFGSTSMGEHSDVRYKCQPIFINSKLKG